MNNQIEQLRNDIESLQSTKTVFKTPQQRKNRSTRITEKTELLQRASSGESVPYPAPEHIELKAEPFVPHHVSDWERQTATEQGRKPVPRPIPAKARTQPKRGLRRFFAATRARPEDIRKWRDQRELLQRLQDEQSETIRVLKRQRKALQSSDLMQYSKPAAADEALDYAIRNIELARKLTKARLTKVREQLRSSDGIADWLLDQSLQDPSSIRGERIDITDAEHRELLLYLMQLERTARRPGGSSGIPKVRPKARAEGEATSDPEPTEQFTEDDFTPEQRRSHEQLFGPDWLDVMNESLEEPEPDDDYLMEEASLAIRDMFEAARAKADAELEGLEGEDLLLALEERQYGPYEQPFDDDE